MDISPCDSDPLAYRRHEDVCSESWETQFGGTSAWPKVLRGQPYTFVTSAESAPDLRRRCSRQLRTPQPPERGRVVERRGLLQPVPILGPHLGSSSAAPPSSADYRANFSRINRGADAEHRGRLLESQVGRSTSAYVSVPTPQSGAGGTDAPVVRRKAWLSSATWATPVCGAMDLG